MKEYQINIIGKGNVGWHLAKAFECKADVRMVNPHTLEGFDFESGVTIIAVTDMAIPQVAEKIVGYRGIVVHTSGSVPMSELAVASEKYGVFYPMQTFTKGKPLPYRRIPVFLEGSSSETTEKLKGLASLISDNVFEADSEKRSVLHLASVLSCNFVNHLWTLADEYLTSNGLDFSMMIPLIEETFSKVKTMKPADAQTGPASRGDTEIVGKHIGMLKDFPKKQYIYRILSDSIIERNK